MMENPSASLDSDAGRSPPETRGTATLAVLPEGTLQQSDDQRGQSRELSLRCASSPGAIPGYEIRRRLGEGSYGSVWLAREIKTGKQVAIKFYTNRRGLDWSLLSREVEKLAVLYTSRDVVDLLDVGWDHDPPYFVMEYLENGSLADKLRDGPLSPEESVRAARSVLRALVHAHGCGILHCDLKPANVLLDGNRDARLCDFGQSRLSTEQCPALGTLYYMAPEQADLNAVPDARWDVYALGALLFQMITGEPPYRTAQTEEQLATAHTLGERLQRYRHIVKESPPPRRHAEVRGVDRRLVEIINGCLEADPQQRLPNAQAVLNLLDERDAVRAKRPLIILGFIGPILCLLAMLSIAWNAYGIALRKADENLVKRSEEDDRVSAALLADGIQQEISTRMRRLEEAAAKISADLKADADYLPSGTETFLENWFTVEKAWLNTQDRTPDESLFLTDATGKLVFRSPTSDQVGNNFAYRSYFHGGLEREEDDTATVEPRHSSGISLAYRSKITKEYMVALAVPVWNKSQTRVLGVLARTLHIYKLLDMYEKRLWKDQGQENHFLALVDLRENEAYLLDHHWLNDRNREKKHLSESEIKNKLRLEPTETKLILEVTEDLTHVGARNDYIDPMANLDSDYGGQWIAAFAPIREVKWIAIVQEPRGGAVRPVGELKDTLKFYGLLTIVVFGCMLGLLWYLIQRAAGIRTW